MSVSFFKVKNLKIKKNREIREEKDGYNELKNNREKKKTRKKQGETVKFWTFRDDDDSSENP